jgi:acyl-coenzyme A synthetase/AMP-(fatty) acid ligase
MTNLAAAVEARADEGGWAGEVAYAVGDRAYTHGQVHEGAARTASLLAGAGVGPGDRVLIALPDGVEFAWAFLGTVRIGAVAVPVNPRVTAGDHGAAAADIGARLVVCPAELAARFAGRPVVVAEDLEAALGGWPACPAVDVASDEPAYAQFTSGTTGEPKAAVHAHGDPVVYFDAFARPAIALGRSDVVFSVSKLYFAYGLGNSLFFPLLAGCRAVLHPGHPRPDDVAETVHRHGVTVLFSVPTSYAQVVQEGRPDAYASLRVAVSAGEPLGVPLARRARALLGCPVLDGLGSTEVGQTFASNTLDIWREGTVGQALPPYRVSVRDERGRPLPRGQVGALWVAGPTLPLGYLGRAPSSAAGRAGRWLCTGDFAVLDADFFLHMRGRSDDVELIGGISVSPVDVEAVLSRHPAVTEVAVAGVVGADGASRLRAFVVAAAGAARAETEAELLALARTELAPFKVPRSVAFVDFLPRTPTGKLRRFVLRSGLWGAEGQPATTSPKRAM